MMMARMAKRGQRIVVRLTMNAQTFPDADSFNTVAEIIGSEHPEQVVLLSGHLDSWNVGQGAMDDGGGALISWEALSLLKDLGLRSRRTLRTVLWSAEEQGGVGAQQYFQLHKIERYVKDSLNVEMAQLQQSAVHNHTAAILDLGTNLLTQTAQHTRKLTDVEIQVLNQTSRLEIQLLENSLSTNKLETQLLHQSTEISKLHDKNRLLDQKMQELESVHHEELVTFQEERSSLQQLVARQSSVITELQTHLDQATGNNSILLSQQQQLTDTVNSLLKLCSKDRGSGVVPNINLAFKQRDSSHEERKYRDCSEIFHAGFNNSGVYTIHINTQETKKVYCNMEAAGGGWSVIQRRKDGTMDFQRTWKEYKMGFGSLFGEHWLGNEFVFLLTSQRPYNLRVEVTDWDGQQAFSHYDRFYIGSEKQNYRLFLKSHRGTAGRQSSLVINGADFSTKDMDNDNCICKCALMLTGGWWFDACGPSNLNGMYYSHGQNMGKLNGIRWHYFKGSSYSLRATTMMIRPADF
ncbi:angiopoietin-1-like isoform X2 [Salvelinus fontinalis]|uniref:angiopoietin-1-like isoform X2 n=1 Tax=Salvelinus fontinalis TaxID=8038 RepID=UPI002484EDB8|nr:angiopoietin-1-like isoform X2 [Salvelinus fontinalis]XP_055759968.1 angiopoietin-1-like isoform X2 [Salvelinus fontinalis]XP_055759969.1 angiopoietin-1-like isoform X2 [Salvelinus fontinalis]XP_055759970.1 angiopoietin-1-like isoform X2 [Salvelinus fontinalis]